MPAVAHDEKAEAEALIARFDASDGAVEVANRFFAFLDEREFTETRIVLAKGTPADSVRQKVWYWAAEWYNDVQNYQQAQTYARKALPLFHQTNADRADCLNLLAIVNVRMGNMVAAADYAKQCVNIDLRVGNPDCISSSLNTLAGIYLAGNQAGEAKSYILQGLQYADRANNPARKAVLLGMASEIYGKLGDGKQALAYARQAFALDSAGGRKDKMAMRLSQMASALAGMNRCRDAESTYRRSIAMLRQTGNAHSEGIALNQLGFVLVKNNHPEEAARCFREASSIFTRMGDLYNNTHSYKGLYESLWTVNPDSARIALETYHALKDSLYQQASASALARYNAEFGADRLQAEVEQHRHVHRRTLLLVMGGIVVVVLVFFLMQRRFKRQRSRMQELVREIEIFEQREVVPTAEKSPAEESLATAEEVPAAAEEELPQDSPFLEQLFRVVDEVMATGEYSVSRIVAAMNMSERTFARRLKEATDKSPKMFLSAIQMERCAKLLVEHPEKTISEVAWQCGFVEASSFSHAFKRVYGCSPSAYREGNHL